MIEISIWASRTGTTSVVLCSELPGGDGRRAGHGRDGLRPSRIGIGPIKECVPIRSVIGNKASEMRSEWESAVSNVPV